MNNPRTNIPDALASAVSPDPPSSKVSEVDCSQDLYSNDEGQWVQKTFPIKSSILGDIMGGITCGSIRVYDRGYPRAKPHTSLSEALAQSFHDSLIAMLRVKPDERENLKSILEEIKEHKDYKFNIIWMGKGETRIDNFSSQDDTINIRIKKNAKPVEIANILKQAHHLAHCDKELVQDLQPIRISANGEQLVVHKNLSSNLSKDWNSGILGKAKAIGKLFAGAVAFLIATSGTLPALGLGGAVVMRPMSSYLKKRPQDEGEITTVPFPETPPKKPPKNRPEIHCGNKERSTQLTDFLDEKQHNPAILHKGRGQER